MKLSKVKKVAIVVIVSIITYFCAIFLYCRHLYDKYELYSDTFTPVDYNGCDPYISAVLRSSKYRHGTEDQKHSYIMDWSKNYTHRKVGEFFHLVLLIPLFFSILLLFYNDDESQ